MNQLNLPDVNECETEQHNCNIPKEKCVNFPGTFRCKPLPECPEGFTRDATSLRCVGKKLLEFVLSSKCNFFHKYFFVYL